ncbi:MAG: triose-phosphate isomerase [Acidobacteria bacterium]|nr:triose-phosphate isomerase [Acidobacteriota bacterium]MBV9070259.1 triose-phosphate isomerase [Acidobacteriota bacterium]MBV9187264.1 triose-phosphate isomerase [Acidobacteriota bacterium]
MPNRYLIANWKMNIPPEGIVTYLDAVKDANAVIAPPFVYLKDVAARFANISAQNCADQKAGAFTGEVSADMLRDCGARFVIIGHSERRTIYGEDDGLIARKLEMVIDAGLTPILCIGENEQQRERGHAVEFCSDQLCAAAIPQLANANEIVVAYEPIWAIGTGRNATGAMVAEIVGAIRDALERFWPDGLASRTSILYGGSVTPDNVDDLIADGRIDGFLVGGASLDSKRFLALAEAMKRLPAQP